MRVALLSAFHNMASRRGCIERYFVQAAGLRDLLAHRPGQPYLRLILVEGDSTDHTQQELAARLADGMWLGSALVDRSHGRHVWHSVEVPERMANLAYVFNGGLDQVAPSDDVVVYVDSDLIWEPGMLLALCSRIEPGAVDLLAPMVFAGEHFYDVWGFRAGGGVRFSPFPPYHHALANGAQAGLFKLDTAGACIAMSSLVARQCRLTEDEAIVGLCKQATARGFNLYLDPSLRVEHPA